MFMTVYDTLLWFSGSAISPIPWLCMIQSHFVPSLFSVKHF